MKRFLIFVSIVAMIMPSASAYAKNYSAPSPTQLETNAQNNILFYSASENACVDDTVDAVGDSDGSDVYMIGDSITVNSRDEILEQMPNITINATSSIYFGYDEPSIGNSGVSRISEMGDQRILLFALGTNGGIDSMYKDDTKKLFDAVNGKDIKVILMTIFYDGHSKEQMEQSNSVVKELASQYENVSYMDWYAAASSDPDKYISSDGVHPTSPDGEVKFAEVAKAAVDKVTTMNLSTEVGNGDYTRVFNAKNADQDVFNLDRSNPGEWYAGWGDGDVAAMTRVLEHYGDLAYQLGDAVGAPWIAIIVQMRYEDSLSCCGHNNFWGNGCPAGTPCGGASIKAANLGEGFMKYGQTLTNGMHNQALGISDPKLYLEKIGPTWVQGDINGPGYGSIDGMKNSVDSLLAFVESDEGQAIVKTFGNYHGTYNTAGGQTMCSDNSGVGNGEPVFYQQGAEPWGSMPYDPLNVCGGTIGSAGCGPTSLASIIATMTGDLSVTPDVIAKKAVEQGYRAYSRNANGGLECSGSSWGITNIAEDYGLKVENLGVSSIEEISNYLRQGWMFQAAAAGPLPFSAGGHFIALRGITSDGKWLIFDSSHPDAVPNTNEREWDPADIYYTAVAPGNSGWRGVHK